MSSSHSPLCSKAVGLCPASVIVCMCALARVLGATRRLQRTHVIPVSVDLFFFFFKKKKKGEKNSRNKNCCERWRLEGEEFKRYEKVVRSARDQDCKSDTLSGCLKTSKLLKKKKTADELKSTKAK